MTDLIKIIEQNGKRAISARDLHLFLESKQDFSNWIKNRIEKYGLIQNTDYEAFDNFIECQNGIGGVNRKEYALTIDCAKELSMVEGNDKGKQARRYFIECEKKLQLTLPRTFAEALQLAADQAKMLEIKEQQLLELQPKASYYDQVLSSTGAITISVIAKDYGLSAIAINQLLNDLKVQYKQAGTWLLYQNHASMGYTKTQTTPYCKTNGDTGVSVLTKWTQKGRLFLYELLKRNGVLPVIEQNNN